MSDHKNAPDPPKQGPLSKIELSKQLNDLFFRPVHIDHQNVTPHTITITNDGKDYYLEQIEKIVTTYTNSVLNEAIGEQQQFAPVAQMSHGNSIAVATKYHVAAVPVAALEALRERLG